MVQRNGGKEGLEKADRSAWAFSSSRKTQMPSPLLSMAALTVEYLKVLMVEHLKVMAALWSSLLTHPYQSSPLKGDGGQSSLLTHPLPWGRVPKGTESLTIHMVRSSPSPLLISRAP